MNQPIITVKNISKKYNITHQKGGYIAMRDVMANIAKKPLSFLKRKVNAIAGKTTKEDFWALKDIDFEVFKGEAIGIIGANGAGKSTLLKILTGITPPTTGEIKMHGKVASLLEVGTGFHQELTGRENIFLNGAILGMTKEEIAEKFDAIVEFSGVKKFIDTPVKRYSSGMMVRLGFSVAAHMEPDILLVDEVLAVGDADFQKKCLGKMDEVTGEEGRTILFVSHNLTAIQNLCKRCVLLEKGKIKMIGKTKDVIKHYLNRQNNKIKLNKWTNTNDKYSNIWFQPMKFFIANDKKTNKKWICIEANIQKISSALKIGYAVYNEIGEMLYWSFSTDVPKNEWPNIKIGNLILKSKIPENILKEGVYKFELIGGLHSIEWILKPKTNVPNIFLKIEKNKSDSPHWITAENPGLLSPIIKWEVN